MAALGQLVASMPRKVFHITRIVVTSYYFAELSNFVVGYVHYYLFDSDQ